MLKRTMFAACAALMAMAPGAPLMLAASSSAFAQGASGGGQPPSLAQLVAAAFAANPSGGQALINALFPLLEWQNCAAAGAIVSYANGLDAKNPQRQAQLVAAGQALEQADQFFSANGNVAAAGCVATIEGQGPQALTTAYVAAAQAAPPGEGTGTGTGSSGLISGGFNASASFGGGGGGAISTNSSTSPN